MNPSRGQVEAEAGGESNLGGQGIIIGRISDGSINIPHEWADDQVKIAAPPVHVDGPDLSFSQAVEAPAYLNRG